MMGKDRSRGWSVFDGIKTFPGTPETLMAEIDAAIAAVEYGHATALLSASSSPPPLNAADANKSTADASGSSPDAFLAEEAYRAACASLAAGRPDDAIRSICIALGNCPPDKASAVAKLQSLSTIASLQSQKQNQQNS